MSTESHFSTLVETTTEVINLQKAIGIEILNRVVLETPVDTGRARGNWQATLDNPAGGESGIHDQSGQGTIVFGTNKLISQAGFTRSYITNNLPYINALNDGTSAQAPTKYIDSAIDTVFQLAEKL